MSSQDPDDKDELVTVRRHWNSSRRTARVRLSDLRHLHFRRPGGGHGASGLDNVGPRPILHVRIHCDRIVTGDVGHSCKYGPPPHEILVCITQKDNDKDLYRRLVELVDEAKTPQKHIRSV